MKNILSIRKGFVLIGALWLTYSVVVSYKGTCDYYLGQKNEGWHLLYKEEGYEVSDYGPVSKEQAMQALNECQVQASEWTRSYGTIYRYSNGDGSVSFLIITAAPLAALYLLDRLRQGHEIY